MQCYSPPGLQIWCLCSLGKSGCSAELLGVTVLSQTLSTDMKFGLCSPFQYLNPLVLRGMVSCKGILGYFFCCLFSSLFPTLYPQDGTPLHCILTHFCFLQILLWLLQLPCSLCVHDLDAFSRETQLLKCSQKFLYQCSSSTCCLVWKFPCQKKSTEVMLCFLCKWGKQNAAVEAEREISCGMLWES